MAERGILFSAPMVRAILAGTKTQTRRVVKWSESWHPDTAAVKIIGIGADGVAAMPYDSFDRMLGGAIRCPYGAPGDRLWVREAWARTIVHPGTEMVVYREGDNRTDYGGPWKPGIHMFRRDSRILLEVAAVRVERLQAISQADAIAEGAPPSHTSIDRVSREFGYPDFPRSWYAQLWDQINGAGAWDANPWVWAVSFRVVKP